MKIGLIFLFFIQFNLYGKTYQQWETPDWSANASISEGNNRENLYQLSEEELEKAQKDGYLHSFKWPIEISGLFIPYESFKYFLEAPQENLLKKFMFNAAKKQIGMDSLEGFYKWVGLQEFPEYQNSGPNPVPFPDGYKPDYYMGASLVKTPTGAKGITFSCAACHTHTLFGTPVMGLNNKRPKANDFFMMGKKYVPLIPPKLYQLSTHASDEEYKLLKRSKKNFKAINAVTPLVSGLDTSLAQIALSLAKRKKDKFATKSAWHEKFPRKNPLSKIPADSKPAVWWNLKYKTRWLSDGSIVSGNPILTNFLWNEIGRGTDLKELKTWMINNQKTIKELSAAVFATKAPRWEKFFPNKKIDLDLAKRGQDHFRDNCMSCHGDYQKGWEKENTQDLSYDELISTTETIYHDQTPVKNVGTDPRRYEGIKYFYKDLNDLEISKWMKTKVVPQKGYVPPPLDGIWSRYPYLHNNSIPSLCDLMTAPEKRVKIFYQGPSDDPNTDYDFECVGYPTGKDIPSSWKKLEKAKYETSRDGMRNIGHYEMFLNIDGSEILQDKEKRELIEFLKTL